MTWDMNDLRKIAGLQESYEAKQTLLERYNDDDDDEDPDVKHADDEAKKRHINLPDAGKIDPDKDMHDLAVAKKQAADKKKAEKAPKKDAVNFFANRVLASKHKEEDKKKEEKKEPAPKKEPVEKKEGEPAAEKKKRGKAENPTSKSGQLRTFIQNHFAKGEAPETVRKAAWKWASETCDPPFTKAGFSTIYQGIKSKNAKKAAEGANECWIIRHPTVPSFILKENLAMNMYQWISDSDVYDEPLVFETEQEAKKVASYLLSFKNQLSDIACVNLDV